VVDLPLGYKSGMQATMVANDVYNHFKGKVLTDTQVMYLHAHGPGFVNTKTKAVRKLEDMKGLKIRSHGTSAMTVKALGGTPVAMPMPETYTALQKGVVDGAMYPMEANKGWKLGEVIDFVTLDYPAAYTTTFFVVMNKDKWNALGPAIQKTIKEINKEWIVKTGKAWDQSDKEGKEYVLKLKKQLISLSPAESKKWKAAVRPVLNQWAEKMKKKNLPGQEALTVAEKAFKKFEK
jgi:TRAP-type transport system periplasmic protein